MVVLCIWNPAASGMWTNVKMERNRKHLLFELGQLFSDIHAVRYDCIIMFPLFKN